jgi:outer membrane protein assembly factor BamE (lipoprotein component of BamABCDE complex)
MRTLLLGVAFALALISPQPARAWQDAASSSLTPGSVSLNLKVGVTTQEQVLNAFGAPNIVTQDGSGAEVWSYQRHASILKSTDGSGYFSVLVFGAGRRISSSEQTQRTMTLIIKFDKDDVVSDFRSRASEF